MSLAMNTDLSKMPALTTGHTTNADNPFESFFGPISVQDGQGVNASSVFAHEAYNLPEAYKGRNLFLGDLLDMLITRTDDWYTARVMPWRETDQIHVSWNVFRFNKTMADLQPEQGVPRYITAESEEHSDSLVRRGLAFIVEHGFYSTERGRQHYLLNLENITESVHMTCYYGVLHALLSGKGHWKEWQRQYGRRTHRVDDLLRMERNRWAIAQKTERGMYILDAELKDMMKYQNVQPDTWILPSKMSIYLTMIPSNEVEYIKGGSSGAIQNNNDIRSKPRDLITFRGSAVCETMPFSTDFASEPTELLRREKMCGSYYTMLPHSRASLDAPGNQYRSDHRSIFIYNCDVDRFEKISLEEALDSCFRFDGNGPNDAHVSVINEYGIPSAKEVSVHDDPLMCHHSNRAAGATAAGAVTMGDLPSEDKLKGEKPNGVCKVLGDLPLHHLRDEDIRAIQAVCLDTAGALKFGLTGAASVTVPGGSGYNVADVSNKFMMEPSLMSAFENAWDPALSAELHGVASSVSASELQNRFSQSFPEQWKSLLSADDFAYARDRVVSEAQALQGDDRAYLNYIQNVNDKYAEHLTDRAVAGRSAFQSDGLLAAAVKEIEAPTTKKRLSAQEKRVKEFVQKFETTSNYWQRQNAELTDSSDVIREIMRNYIQPLSSRDAMSMEQKIEAAIDAGETLTPGALDAAKQELTSVTERANLAKLAKDLEAAGVNAKTIDRGITTGDRRAVKVGLEKSPFKGVVNAATDSSDEYKVRVVRGLSETVLKIKLTKDNLMKMIENNVPFPFGFLLCRPFQRYDMCSAILCRAGARLGQTFIGHSDFQLADNVINKTHVGHYTFYSKSIVHDEREYTIAEDVFAAGYKGGENTQFYREREELLDDIGAESFRASIICMLIPYRTNQPRGPRIKNPIDITGSLHPTLYQDTDIPAHQIEGAMYPGARYYAELLELKKMSSYASDATEHFLSPYRYINTVCFQGMQWMYNHAQQGFTDKIRNTGHWGPHGVYPGCKAVRCGDNAFFDDREMASPM